MKRFLAGALVAAGLFAFAGCELLDQLEDAAQDAGLLDSDGGLAFDAGWLLNDGGSPDPCVTVLALPNTAQEVHQMGTPDPMPEPMGGTIAQGLYLSERSTRYETEEGPTGNSERVTLLILGGVAHLVVEDDGEQRMAFDIATEGTSITLTARCPPLKGTVLEDIQAYTATEDELTLYNLAEKKEYVLARQQVEP